MTQIPNSKIIERVFNRRRHPWLVFTFRSTTTNWGFVLVFIWFWRQASEKVNALFVHSFFFLFFYIAPKQCKHCRIPTRGQYQIVRRLSNLRILTLYNTSWLTDNATQITVTPCYRTDLQTLSLIFRAIKLTAHDRLTSEDYSDVVRKKKRKKTDIKRINLPISDGFWEIIEGV